MMDTGSQSAGNSQLDWLAGIIDGEGSLMLSRRLGGKHGPSFKPMLSIANTHHPTIERAAAILQAAGVGVWICTGRRKTEKYPAQYTIHCTGYKRMMTFLKVMQHRLFTKRRQADLLVKFCESRNGGWAGKPYTEAERQMVDEVAKLNKSRYWTGASETTRATPEGDDIVRPDSK